MVRGEGLFFIALTLLSGGTGLRPGRHTVGPPLVSRGSLVRRSGGLEDDDNNVAPLVVTPNLGNGTGLRNLLLARAGSDVDRLFMLEQQARASVGARIGDNPFSRFSRALKEFLAYASWQVGRNARGDIAGDDLRREISVRWRQLQAITRGDGTTITGSSSITEVRQHAIPLRTPAAVPAPKTMASWPSSTANTLSASSVPEISRNFVMSEREAGALEQPLLSDWEEIYFGEPNEEEGDWTDQGSIAQATPPGASAGEESPVFDSSSIAGPTSSDEQMLDFVEYEQMGVGAPTAASPFLYGSPLDEEHLLLLDTLVAGGSLDWEGAVRLIEETSARSSDEDEEELTDTRADGEGAFELMDTVIAGKWRSRRKKGRSEIYFDSGGGSR
jgi:hypothetical protein